MPGQYSRMSCSCSPPSPSAPPCSPSAPPSYNSTCSDGGGPLAVHRAALTVTAENKSKTYGDADPTFTFSYSGFLGSDSASDIDTPPTCSVAGPHTDVGTYPITCSGGVDNNYTFSYNGGTLTVNKAALTVTAENKSKTYGDADPAFTFQYSGFVNGDNAGVIDTPPTCGVEGPHTNVGGYAITCSGGADNNYTFSYNSGALTVNKAALTVTAENKSKTFGDADPAFTFSYSGFLGSDSASDIDTPPTCGVAVPHTEVGSYPITCSGGADNNYTFSYNSGTLTVNPKVITDGRMTGGGSILPDGDGGRNNLRITHGFELHCDPNDVPNNLEVDWNTSSARDSHQFRLDRLSTVSCTDNPSINQGPPSNSEFDTISGTGTGFYNGQPGSIITFVFTDAGQPGRNDTAYYRIEFPSGTVVLEAQGTLQNGNQQAH